MDKYYHMIQDAVANEDWAFFDAENVTWRSNGAGHVQLCYKQVAQWVGHTPITRRCRGHVYDKHGALLARPFEKFVNVGERGEYPDPNDELIGISEKMDGSLAIVYFDTFHGSWDVVTKQGLNRGWDNVEQLETVFSDILPDVFEVGYTYLFEFTGKANKHVVDYSYDSDMVYLARINNQDGEVTPFFIDTPCSYWSTPSVTPTQTIDELVTYLETVDKNTEGFVLYYRSGAMYKLKSQAYLDVHRFLFNLTLKNVIRSGAINDENKGRRRNTQSEGDEGAQKYKTLIPEELHNEFHEHVNYVYFFASRFWDTLETIDRHVDELEEEVERELTQKEFAGIVNKYVKSNIDKGFVFTYYSNNTFNMFLYAWEHELWNK